MEAIFRELAQAIALGLEAAAVLIITLGSIDALGGIARMLRGSISTHGRRKEVWRRFGTWLLLGLEFELAADIVRSVIAPTWMEIGQLGAIAVIRTFLNYFLEKDLEQAEGERAAGMASADAPVRARDMP